MATVIVLKGITMHPKKTLVQREKKLQALLASPAGRDKLQRLVARYQEAGGRVRPKRTSIVTYILVHERGRGFISN